MKWNERRAMLMGLTVKGPVFDKPEEGGNGAGGDGGDDTPAKPTGTGEEGTDRSEPKPESGLKGGLLDRRKKDDDADAGNDPDTIKKPEADGRPEGVPEKFWDAEKGEIKTDGMVKAYTDLEKAHGKLRREKSIGGEIPESADDYFKDGLDLGDDVDRLSIDGPDDPGLKAWGKVCHKWGLGAEAAVGMAKEMFGLMNEHAAEPLDPDREFEALGKNAEGIIEGVFTWVEGAEQSGKLSEADIGVVNDLQKTANGMRFLAAMRAMSGAEAIPYIPASGAKGMSQDQWHAEYKDAVAAKDYARQEELDAIGKTLNGEQASHGGRQGGVDPEKSLRGRRRSA